MDVDDSEKCFICEKYADREIPKDELQNEICRTFGNPEMVNDDIFSVVEALIAKWQKRKFRHSDLIVEEKLKKEEITDDGMEHIKQYLISFATQTNSIKLFRETISLLVLYKDPSILPLYQGWLNKYFREYLLIGSTINELIDGIESTGVDVVEKYKDKCEWADWSTEFNAARNYLIEELKIII